jgi:hypothetical protein
MPAIPHNIPHAMSIAGSEPAVTCNVPGRFGLPYWFTVLCDNGDSYNTTLHRNKHGVYFEVVFRNSFSRLFGKCALTEINNPVGV